MERRTALKIVALGAIAPKLDAMGASMGRMEMDNGAAWSPGDYKLRFFTEEENALLDQLMEMIIPADSHSPGAHAAQVSFFADLMVATGGKADQAHWRSGLKLMQEEVAKSSPAEALAKSAANEGRPTTDLERFFGTLKDMTVNGYYTSSIGIHQDLQYQGNTYVSAFPGCTIKKVMSQQSM